MQREHWLAVRASPSLGRLFRERGRFAHVSKTPRDFATKRQHYAGFFRSRQCLPGRTLDLGRNAAKREIRKGARKCWRVLGRA